MKITESSLLFATAFYHSAGRAPNAWTIFQQSKIKMYYQCMIVSFASLRRWHPDARLALFTNRSLPEPFNSQLASLQVSTVICPSSYVTDLSFKNDFPGCLYSLDVITHLARTRSTEFSCLILLDSDCIVRSRPDGLIADLASNGEAIHAYGLGYPVNMVLNGQSRASLTLALSYFSGQMVASPIIPYGGEFYAVPAGELPGLANRIEAFWGWMKSKGVHSFGNSLTEEHVMSVVLAERGGGVRDAGGLVKRIWTASNFSNVAGDESEIPIWHLPAEKKRGFVKLYRYWLANNGFDGLNDADFRALIDKTVSLRPGGRKYPGRSLSLRLGNAARVLVTGRM